MPLQKQLMFRTFVTLLNQIVLMGPRKPFRPDVNQTRSLLKAGRTAAIDARRNSRAHGLTVTFIQGTYIYEELPDGTTKRIGTIEDTVVVPDTLTKGVVLRARE